MFSLLQIVQLGTDMGFKVMIGNNVLSENDITLIQG
jgi:hypothetical protein